MSNKYVVKVPAKNRGGKKIQIEWVFQDLPGAEKLAKKCKAKVEAKEWKPMAADGMDGGMEVEGNGRGMANGRR